MGENGGGKKMEEDLMGGVEFELPAAPM